MVRVDIRKDGAENVKYDYDGYFAEAFRKNCGCSPSEYRAKDHRHECK